MKASKISVILPAYNERDVIDTSIRAVADALADFNHEIIVVDDGSTDDTLERAERAAAVDPCIQVIHYQPNRGKGHALKQGFSCASGEYVAFLDADSDLPPAQLLTLWKTMQACHADVVIGSKLHPASKLNYPILRRMVSWCYFNLVHFLFGLPIHDTQTGIKLFRREVLEQVFPHLEIKGFAFDLELLVGSHLFGYSMVEAPVTIEFQRDDSRPLNVVRASLNIALDTLRVFYWASFWKWLDPGVSIKFWLIALLAGLVAGSVSVGHLLNNFSVPRPLDSLVDLMLLRFLDRNIRDLILLVGGVSVIVLSAVQLNKQIVAAFTRRGRTDFWENKGK